MLSATHIRSYTPSHTHAYMHKCVRAHTRTHTHMHTHAYMYSHAVTHLLAPMPTPTHLRPPTHAPVHAGPILPGGPAAGGRPGQAAQVCVPCRGGALPDAAALQPSAEDCRREDRCGWVGVKGGGGEGGTFSGEGEVQRTTDGKCVCVCVCVCAHVCVRACVRACVCRVIEVRAGVEGPGFSQGIRVQGWEVMAGVEGWPTFQPTNHHQPTTNIASAGARAPPPPTDPLLFDPPALQASLATVRPSLPPHPHRLTGQPGILILTHHPRNGESSLHAFTPPPPFPPSHTHTYPPPQASLAMARAGPYPSPPPPHTHPPPQAILAMARAGPHAFTISPPPLNTHTLPRRRRQ